MVKQLSMSIYCQWQLILYPVRLCSAVVILWHDLRLQENEVKISISDHVLLALSAFEYTSSSSKPIVFFRVNSTALSNASWFKLQNASLVVLSSPLPSEVLFNRTNNGEAWSLTSAWPVSRWAAISFRCESSAGTRKALTWGQNECWCWRKKMIIFWRM